MQKRVKNILKSFKLHESTLSIIFGAITIVVIAALLFNVYRQNRANQQISDQGQQTEQPQEMEKIGDVEVKTNETGEKVPAQLPETYKVQRGEHLWMIAERYYGSGYNWVDIARANELENPGVLVVDQELKLPEVAVKQVTVAQAEPETQVAPEQVISGNEYTVVKGDNLWNIAVRAYQDGYRWPEIARANNLENPNLILPDQKLTLPR